MQKSLGSPTRSSRARPVVLAALALLAAAAIARATGVWTGGKDGALGILTQPLDSALRVLAISPEAASGLGKRGPVGGPLPVVTVSRPVAREVVEWDDYTGRFDAVETVEVRARVAGYLDKVHFKDGQVVAKGDPLFTIDPRPFERALEQAQAELTLAQTKLANANLDVNRGEPLVERKVMSQKTFDDRASIKREAEAAVKVAEAKVRTAELDLQFTRVLAPISGRMSRTLVTAGNYVSAGGAATPTMLTTIVSQSPIYLYFDVSEANTIKYRRLLMSGARASVGETGAVIELGLPDEQGFPHRGLVDFSDNRLDAGTSTLRARALVENKDGLFTAGMFARVRVAGSSPAMAVLLPDEAFGTDQASKFAYVVADDGSVRRQVVELGPLVSGMRVVRKGLKAEDWIVVKGLQRARPGQKVNPNRQPLQMTDAAQPASAAP